MSTDYIDLNDIQGNIVKAYGRKGYPCARYLFFEFRATDGARDFIAALLPLITTGKPWGKNALELPEATTNIAFSYAGLEALQLPVETLRSFPEEFCVGMKSRGRILGDDDASHHDHWDPIWQDTARIHMFLSINARNPQALAQRFDRIVAMAAATDAAVQLREGHRGAGGKLYAYQSAAALERYDSPTNHEHFGYADGLSDPFFKGCGRAPSHVVGSGKPTRRPPQFRSGWQPLETGEFILGYRDEAGELPPSPAPKLLAHNGTFMVYRKLHQNVASFRRYLDAHGERYHGGPKALAAKLAGRWPNGAPVTEFPTEQAANDMVARLEVARHNAKRARTPAEQQAAEREYEYCLSRMNGFNYDRDIAGTACPMGAHIRRANPRGALEFGKRGAFITPGALVNRRRILRRGLPYGLSPDATRDDDDHGLIFMAMNASIKRQFEFVQEQWINYGNDFRLANDRDPLIGNQKPGSSMTIASDNPNRPPYFCTQLPRFVETRGGEYFFVPSITAIRMIAADQIDPT